MIGAASVTVYVGAVHKANAHNSPSLLGAIFLLSANAPPVRVVA